MLCKWNAGILLRYKWMGEHMTIEELLNELINLDNQLDALRVRKADLILAYKQSQIDKAMMEKPQTPDRQEPNAEGKDNRER